MHDLFTRGVDENGHLRPTYEEAPDLYKPSELGWIPKEWKMTRLEDITTHIIDGTHFTPTYVEYGVPFLRVTDIQEDDIRIDDLKRIPENEHKVLCQRCSPQRGDLLLSKNGTVGVPKVVDWDWEFSIFVSLALIRPAGKLVDVKYLYHLFQTDVIWSQIRRRSKQGTVTNLHLEEIRELLVPVPPIPEQDRLDARLETLKWQTRLEASYLKNLRQTKSGLMQDLLTGKVRVKVDEPEDE